MTHSKSELLALLDLNGLKPKRSLGQNFVVDANILRKIVALADLKPGDHVVEVGSGIGSLSLALLESGADVTCVEIDKGLAPILREQVEHRGARVVLGDAMKLDWKDVLGAADSWTMVANLPYNIATPLVCDLLDEQSEIAKLVVMVQREVAQRMVAAPNTPEYGAVSTKVAYWAKAKIVANVPPSVFVPRPRVDSAVVLIERRESPAVDPSLVPPEFLFNVIYKAFNQRRKQVQKSLRETAVVDDFVTAGIEPSARPQELDIVQWGKLCACIYARTQN